MRQDNKTELGKINLKRKAVGSHGSDALSADQQAKLDDMTAKLMQLSAQTGKTAANIEALQINLQILDILPREIAEQHVILPIQIDGNDLHLAMASPDDTKVIDEIEFVSGKNVIANVALRSQLIRLIDTCYDAKDRNENVYEGPFYGLVPPPEPVVNSEKPKNAAGTAQGADTDLGLELEMDFPLEEQLTSINVLGGIEDEPEPELEVQKKILVVDDEDDIRLLISRVLTDRGYDVVTAGRGLEAVQMVQNEEPDMIILDAMLPEVHGFDICRKIKGSRKYGHIPVIMISAIYRGWRYAQDLKDSYGVDDFIEKPFKLSEFVEKVEKLLAADNRELAEAHEDLTKKTEDILLHSIQAYKSGDVDGAIELLKKGLEIDPLAYKLHYNLALLLGKKALNYQAIRELESTLELEPNYFPAMKNLALLYQKAGFKFKAIETWERSLHYCPDDDTKNSIKQHLMDIL